MILETVTITGADDSVDTADLHVLSAETPWIEWGILMSDKHSGVPRFPSHEWIAELFLDDIADDTQIAWHVCGDWAADVVYGGSRFTAELFKATELTPVAADRVQLNFHGLSLHGATSAKLSAGLKALGGVHEVIFQLDGVNDHLAQFDVAPSGVAVVPLFDRSGGTGLLPSAWPVIDGSWIGYAGGLTPTNVQSQLEALARVLPEDQRIWIDVETGVRDHTFDLDLVCAFRDACAPWVDVKRRG